MNPSAYDAGTLLRTTREAAQLSLRGLADLAGTNHGALSAYERGRTQPSMAVLQRLLAAMGRQLVLSTEPLHADLDRAIERARTTPMAERVRGLPVHVLGMAEVLDGAPHVVTGATAAFLHGAPVPVTEYTITVPDDDAALGAIASRLRWTLLWRPGAERAYPAPQQAERRSELLRNESPSRWELPAEGPLVVHVGALPPFVEIVCEGRPIPVCALDAVEVDDAAATYVLARLGAALGTMSP